LPWELGLAEAQQTLLKNGLRDRVVLQTDGQIKTGRDVAIATLLGAEEWGVATAALVVEGCIMMRKCHLNTCPVGVATQDPELRKRFNGNAEYVINFFKFLAEELREIMAQLGFRTINEMVGRVDCLQQNQSTEFWKYQNIDLSPLLYEEVATNNSERYNVQQQEHDIDEVLDWKILEFINQAIDDNRSRFAEFAIKNTDRAVGAIISNEISKKYGKAGMPEDFVDIRFVGSAGQSFGAFAAKGLKFTLEGEANDYLGKGLSGAKLIVSSHRDSTFDPSKNIIVGNVALYGATSGEVYIKGMAGERFAVRNSGAKAVVEGIGDHGCEYMTGGLVLVLGETGKNFAAGMSGGMAFIFNQSKAFEKLCNKEMVDIDPLMEEDFTLIRQLLRNHFLFTGSRQAVNILNNWSSMREHFVKVMPKEYKRVLADQKKQAS
jgi:glutamate synthase (NADPH/NADH) large chain